MTKTKHLLRYSYSSFVCKLFIWPKSKLQSKETPWRSVAIDLGCGSPQTILGIDTDSDVFFPFRSCEPWNAWYFVWSIWKIVNICSVLFLFSADKDRVRERRVGVASATYTEGSELTQQKEFSAICQCSQIYYEVWIVQNFSSVNQPKAIFMTWDTSRFQWC